MGTLLYVPKKKFGVLGGKKEQGRKRMEIFGEGKYSFCGREEKCKGKGKNILRGKRRKL